jgi:hypothetical protein
MISILIALTSVLVVLCFLAAAGKCNRVASLQFLTTGIGVLLIASPCRAGFTPIQENFITLTLATTTDITILALGNGVDTTPINGTGTVSANGWTWNESGTYMGKILNLSYTGVLDATSNIDSWSVTGSLGSGTFSGTGSLQFVGDPTGMVTASVTGPTASGSVNYSVSASVTFMVGPSNNVSGSGTGGIGAANMQGITPISIQDMINMNTNGGSSASTTVNTNNGGQSSNSNTNAAPSGLASGVTTAAVPEPPSMIMVIVAMMMVILYARYKNRRRTLALAG